MNYITEARKIYGMNHLTAAFGLTRQAVRKWELFGIPKDRIIEFCEAVEWRFTPHDVDPVMYPNPFDALPANHIHGLQNKFPHSTAEPTA